MDECDLEPVQPAAGNHIDEVRADLGELAQGRLHVVGLERDVMHAGTSTREEATNGGVLPGRSEQLDATGADKQRGGLDPLAGQLVAMLHSRAKQPLVGRDRLIEVSDGDADVVDSAQVHAGDASGAPGVPGFEA